MRKIILFIVIGILLSLTLSSKVFAQFDELQIYTPDEPVPQDSTPLTQRFGGIKGKVVSSGKPLSNASIILSNGMNTVTNANGEYEIDKIEAGVYGIEIFKDGYKPAHGNVVISENEKKAVLIDLSKIKSNNSTKTNRRNTAVSKRNEYTTMNIKVYPTKDLTGGFHNYGKLWWVYSISVEDKNGNGKWNEIYSKPHHGDGFSSAVKELYCRDAIKGHTYRIEIEWRSFRGSDSKTRYWDEKLDIEDKNFIFDCPSGY